MERGLREQQVGSPAELDDSRDFEVGAADIVLGGLTLPLLPWALMYAVTGHERLYATRRGRMRVYVVLLAVEVIIAVAIATVWVMR